MLVMHVSHTHDPSPLATCMTLATAAIDQTSACRFCAMEGNSAFDAGVPGGATEKSCSSVCALCDSCPEPATAQSFTGAAMRLVSGCKYCGR